MVKGAAIRRGRLGAKHTVPMRRRETRHVNASQCRKGATEPRKPAQSKGALHQVEHAAPTHLVTKPKLVSKPKGKKSIKNPFLI